MLPNKEQYRDTLKYLRYNDKSVEQMEMFQTEGTESDMS